VLGGPGVYTFYLSVQAVGRLCAGPSPTPDAPDLARMVAFGEEMRREHIVIGVVLLVALALQIRALALLAWRCPTTAREASRLGKRE
jgi:hypothetical protein